MSSQSAAFEGGLQSYEASEDLNRGTRVKFGATNNQVEYADKGDVSIGWVENSYTDGQTALVMHKFSPGTRRARIAASVTVAIGDTLYPAANGEYDKTSSGASLERYRALEAVTGAASVNPIIEVYPITVQ